MKLRRLCTSLCLVVGLTVIGLPVLGLASSPTVKQQKIKKLMDMTSAGGDVSMQVMNQMLDRLRTMVPGGSDAFWTEFKKQINVSEMVALMIPIYDKHFSEEEIDSMIKFFEGSAGKKFLSEMPIVMQESMVVGDKWGAPIYKQAKEQLGKQKKK